eukprot:scaffold16416_cov52-Attheya_sp.AAC.12
MVEESSSNVGIVKPNKEPQETSLEFLSEEQASHLNTLLRKPQKLDGQPTMVPMTTKAFFPGILRTQSKRTHDPEDPNHTTQTASSSIDDERILIRLGTNKNDQERQFTEMTRKQVVSALDDRQKKMDSKKSTAPPQQSSNKGKKGTKNQGMSSSGWGKGFLNTKKTSTTKLNNPVKHPSNVKEILSAQSPTSSSLPFIEIREEYDTDGKEIRSEIVNVAEELKELKDKVRQKKKTGPPEDGTAEDSETPETVMSDWIERISMDAIDDDSDHVAEEEEVRQKQLRYEEISSRLEELERLEEMDVKEKKVNKKSSKQLQSKGWSKGFLTSSPTSKKTKANSVPPNKVPSSLNKPNIGKETLSKTVPSVSVPPKKKVGFSDSDNDVRSIPRIGQRSIREVTPPSRGNRKSFDSSVFSGVIAERPVSAVVATPPTLQEAATAPKKKLSRFAQQRLENQQFQEEQQQQGY